MSRRLATGSATVAALAALILAAVSQAAAVHGRCDRHRASMKTRTVLVFRQETSMTDGVGNPLTLYYACARPGGRPVSVAADAASSGGEYDSNSRLLRLTIAGDYVAAMVVKGEGDEQVCEKYQQPHCPSPWVRITVANVRAGTKVHVNTSIGAKSLLVSSRGAVAWLVADSSGSARLLAGAVNPHGPGWAVPVAQLGSGQISDVQLLGLTVTWRDQGGAHAVTLRSTG